MMAMTDNLNQNVVEREETGPTQDKLHNSIFDIIKSWTEEIPREKLYMPFSTKVECLLYHHMAKLLPNW